ncbi:hypothetical protein HG530_002101 [Fusarium avenaceum]|nr:hypothetical protein HG530_002101 [Fusarium avenaceum]
MSSPGGSNDPLTPTVTVRVVPDLVNFKAFIKKVIWEVLIRLIDFLLLELPFLYGNITQTASKRLDHAIRALDWHEGSKNPSRCNRCVSGVVFSNPAIAKAELGRFGTSRFCQFIKAVLQNVQILLDNTFWPRSYINLGEIDLLQVRQFPEEVVRAEESSVHADIIHSNRSKLSEAFQVLCFLGSTNSFFSGVFLYCHISQTSQDPNNTSI